MLNKKKIIFAVLIFGLLFFVFNVNTAKAGGASNPCKNFCTEKCPELKEDGAGYDDSCRKVGAKGEGYLCSCCQCTYVDLSKNKDVECQCFCQGDSANPALSGNKITNCHTGGLFRDWHTAVCACCGDCTLNDLLYIGASVAELILKYLGVIALFLFVLGGIIWITSGGSKEKVKKGTAILKGAIVGMIIVIVAYSAIRIIMKDMLGVDSDYLPESSNREYRIS